eukprot:TRINITY_DN73842_c0_g1_i1.p1 TRINITY_DN73842_c0_g1~~TRINITY_DN73842_c0_g1_i1.p1  ORF type:complete len:728 (+),score=96.65 TRINITY_DN73842_c0_g1_i1:109-2292(+)
MSAVMRAGAAIGFACGVGGIGLTIAAAEEATQSKGSDILGVLSWCREADDGVSWPDVITLAEAGCGGTDDEGAVLRIHCSDETVEQFAYVARMLIESSTRRTFACANGLVLVFAVVLAYGRELLSPRDAARSQVLLWGALQENFVLDMSIWPVKTHDVLQLFHNFPATLRFPALPEGTVDLVTFLVPRCPVALATEIRHTFPGVAVFAGAPQNERLEVEAHASSNWKIFKRTWGQPVGYSLNEMLAEVSTPLVLVVVGGALPRALVDLEQMIHVMRSRRVIAVGGPLVDADRIYSDFCHKLRPVHYELSFDTVYEHSIIFDEESRSSVRGSWFHDDAVDKKEGPCKLCDTLPPTFLARTEALYALRFNPSLDGEWALLEFALRASRGPFAEVRRHGEVEGGGKEQPPSTLRHGWRHGPPSLALCPFVGLREVEGLGGPHLYGRHDLPLDGVSHAAAWFGEDGVALGIASGDTGEGDEIDLTLIDRVGLGPSLLRPTTQFNLFMEMSYLRNFRSLDGAVRYAGCNLATTNCPVTQWVYRGWAIPPCCKETMRHLLFYIADLFSELGIRFIITDGVLLGSYKFGRMLNWDADVDLHIHDDDFWRLEGEVTRRVAADGHFVRKHVNNRSFLLQANDHNYLLIELNKREEPWDPESVWYLPVEGRLFPAMEDAHLNLSSWYGVSFFKHRLRHVPDWEEDFRPMFCGTPYHYNCVDETLVPTGGDCRQAGLC